MQAVHSIYSRRPAASTDVSCYTEYVQLSSQTSYIVVRLSTRIAGSFFGDDSASSSAELDLSGNGAGHLLAMCAGTYALRTLHHRTSSVGDVPAEGRGPDASVLALESTVRRTTRVFLHILLVRRKKIVRTYNFCITHHGEPAHAFILGVSLNNCSTHRTRKQKDLGFEGI
jgi:hypothetical protein